MRNASQPRERLGSGIQHQPPQDNCVWPPFLSVTQSWLPPTVPCAMRIRGSWVDGFLVFFFFFFLFLPSGWGIALAFFCCGLFLFHFRQDQFQLQGLEKRLLKDAASFSLRPRFLYSVLNRSHSSYSLLNQQHPVILSRVTALGSFQFCFVF